MLVLLTTGKDDFATIAVFNGVAKMNHWSKGPSTFNSGFWALRWAPAAGSGLYNSGLIKNLDAPLVLVKGTRGGAGQKK